MSGQACRVCGCTDEYGCEEICWWVERDKCSVCTGDTPRDRRHYTRTAILRQEASPVPTDALAIYDPDGHLRGAAWSIEWALAIARGLDWITSVAGPRPAEMIAGEMQAFAGEMEVTQPRRRQRWQRGPIARRPNTRLG